MPRTVELLPKEQFGEYHEAGWQDACMDVPRKGSRRVTEEGAQRIMRRITRCGSYPEFQALEEGRRAKLIRKLKEEGLSLRQISRLTGESVYKIQKY